MRIRDGKKFGSRIEKFPSGINIPIRNTAKKIRKTVPEFDEDVPVVIITNNKNVEELLKL
jgi:hypothetical protein